MFRRDFIRTWLTFCTECFADFCIRFWKQWLTRNPVPIPSTYELTKYLQIQRTKYGWFYQPQDLQYRNYGMYMWGDKISPPYAAITRYILPSKVILHLVIIHQTPSPGYVAQRITEHIEGKGIIFTAHYIHISVQITPKNGNNNTRLDSYPW